MLPNLLTVEIAPGGDPDDPSSWSLLWDEITEHVRQEPGVTITGGRRDEGQQVDSSTAVLTLDNRDGRFSPRNPLSPYYPNLAQNTPIRIRWDGTNLFEGFVSEWPPRWDITGKEANVPIRCDGILRRMRQQSTPLESALTRATVAGGPVNYWPCEDPAEATRATSAVSSFPMLAITPRPDLLQSGDAIRFGGAAFPDGSTGSVTIPTGFGLQGTIANVTTDGWAFEAWVDFGTDAQTLEYRVEMITGSQALAINNGHNRYLFRLSSDTYDVIVEDYEGSAVPNIWGGLNIAWPDAPLVGVHHVLIDAVAVVPNQKRFELWLDGAQIEASSTISGGTPPRPNFVRVYCTSADGTDLSMSHPTFWGSGLSTAQVGDRVDAGNGFAGELAADRIERLCAEEAVTVTIVGDGAETQPMGPQGSSSLLDLLRECETADGGLLYEVAGGLAYRTRFDHYNQAVTLSLDVDNSDIAETPQPTDDDQQLRNEIVATRDAGGSYTLRNQDSIDRNGRYADGLSVNIDDPTDLPNHAGWAMHLGTVDEMRWPQLALALHRQTALIDTWLLLQATPGQRATVDHSISQLPGVSIDVHVDGWSQFLNREVWNVVMNCSPAAPWQVGIIEDDTQGRLDTGGAELASGIDADDTSLSVATTDGPVWINSTDHASMFPFDVLIGGERMTVTAISGTSSPQTFTVTRGVNGIAKSHSAGAAVVLAVPLVLAL